MRVTEYLHALKIPFTIPLSPEKQIDRSVYSFIILADGITLIDCGVAGAEAIIFDYLRKNGRDPREISRLVLSHSHPDHLGAAKKIKEMTGCSIAARQNEKQWIEDTEKQCKERPVPGFHSLVGGPVLVDKVLADGNTLDFGGGLACTVMLTPGHSNGSISCSFPTKRCFSQGTS